MKKKLTGFIIASTILASTIANVYAMDMADIPTGAENAAVETIGRKAPNPEPPATPAQPGPNQSAPSPGATAPSTPEQGTAPAPPPAPGSAPGKKIPGKPSAVMPGKKTPPPAPGEQAPAPAAPSAHITPDALASGEPLPAHIQQPPYDMRMYGTHLDDIVQNSPFAHGVNLGTETLIVKDGNDLWLVSGNFRAKLSVLVYVDPDTMHR